MKRAMAVRSSGCRSTISDIVHLQQPRASATCRLAVAILAAESAPGVSQTVQDCPSTWRLSRFRAMVRRPDLSISANVTTADSHAGTFTAACGVFVWRGHSLPPAYRGGVFSCDPTGNLVHFDKLTQDGSHVCGPFDARRQEFSPVETTGAGQCSWLLVQTTPCTCATCTARRLNIPTTCRRSSQAHRF